jgi:phosphoenolpyruvate phosphomutase / 2-hydroxyethylphosphonate cytidylyltransferase
MAEKGSAAARIRADGDAMSKVVYIGMTADILHHGHINIIEHGRKYGDVIIGLLTDRAVSRFKRLPYLEYEHRKRILENIAGVAKVIPQEDWDYAPNLRLLRPDFMVHGSDWLEGPQGEFRRRAYEAMSGWGGQIIEIPYTRGVSSARLDMQMRALGTTPDIRLRQLRRQVNAAGLARVMEVHSPLCGLIVETLEAEREGRPVRFDAMWSSSLTDSTVRGKPDIEALDHTARLSGINDLFEVTTKPLLYDADTGGRIEHFTFTVRSLERMGVSGVIIEDKTGLKKNSLLGSTVAQSQDSIEVFSKKIAAGKAAQVTDDFMIIGRIESLILNAGLDDALRRARAYVEAGADGIMIHGRDKTPAEIFEFCDRFRATDKDTLVVAVPTAYNSVYESELADRGVNIVIYANHLLRASYPAMSRVARAILENGRSLEADEQCMSVDQILKLIPGTI